MEQNYPPFPGNPGNPVNPYNQLSVTEEIKSYIAEAAKWMKFIAIIGFVAVGLMVLGGVFVMAAAMMAGGFRAGEMAGMGFAYFILAILYYFPISYLLRAANGLKEGVLSGNQVSLTSGFQNLKSHYKFIGIMTIIILSLYAVFFLFGIVMVGLMR